MIALYIGGFILVVLLFIRKEREFDYKDKDYVSNYLSWGYLVKDEKVEGIVFNKNGSLQRTFKFVGKDVDSLQKSDLTILRAKINNALKRLDGNWSFHIEARRISVKDYKKSEYKTDFLKGVDFIREKKYNSGEFFESEYYITFCCFAPIDTLSRIKDKLVENVSKNKDTLIFVKEFNARVKEVVDLLEGSLNSIKPLNDEETLTYLHSCFSQNSKQKVQPMDHNVFLDAYLSDTPIQDGMPPRVGDEYLGAVSILSFPTVTFPAMFDEINELGFEYRWTSRFIYLSNEESKKIAAKIKGKWANKRKDLLTALEDKKMGTDRTSNLEAADREAEAESMLYDLQNEAVAAGYYTFTILLKDKDPVRLREKQDKILSLIQKRGFIGIIESLNVLEAFFGSMPVDLNHNVRKVLVPTTTAIDLMQFATVWNGDKENKYFNDKPLFYASSSEREGKTVTSSVICWNLHVGDVGHTSIYGRTGGGKSVFLCFLASQFMKYKDSQVFFFDKGGSSKVLANVCGGKFYNLGKDTVSFQPLHGIGFLENNIFKATEKLDNYLLSLDTAEKEKFLAEKSYQDRLNEIDKAEKERANFEKTWAFEWICEILMQENVVLLPEHKARLNEALNSVANLPYKNRTMSQLALQLQMKELRQAIDPYTTDGAFGIYFDSNIDSFNSEHPFQVFEIEKIMQLKKACPIMLSYIFHKLEIEMFSKGKPSLLILDECWALLDNEYFAEKIKEWLKVLRKKNVSVVFATQEINDVLKSSIKDALVSSCPTTVYLSNPRASNTDYEIYRELGLNNKQIATITNLQSKKDYYSVSTKGNLVFNLDLSPFELSVFGASTPEAQGKADEIKKEVEAMNLKGIDYANEFFSRWCAWKDIKRPI